MEREALAKLQEWRKKSQRKPLIIQGARQVGKTWLMKEFGRTCFETTAYINFDNNERMKAAFEGNYDIPLLIRALEIESGVTITSEKTLIIFDEIQEVPKALSSLKYFNENAPEYTIVAAGSLPGIALHPGTSFPVGKVDFMPLYPLSFCEFLAACGEKNLVKILKSNDFPMMNIFAGKYKEFLKIYYYIGGMPEAVQTYVDTKNFTAVRTIQKQLLLYYVGDFSKHAPETGIQRINQVWNSIPAQLAKENRKFIFGLVRDGGRAKDFELAVQWLHDCELIHTVYRVTVPKIPLVSYKEMNMFKIFLHDVGLLAAMGDLDTKSIIDGNRIFTEFKGALTEQFVAQELIAVDGLTPYYYSTNNSRGEIDFLIQKNGEVIPIEVKAEENLRAKSLSAYCEKYSPKTAIRTSMSNYRKEEWMTNIPLYALAEALGPEM
jgi:uncharacterized protein